MKVLGTRVEFPVDFLLALEEASGYSRESLGRGYSSDNFSRQSLFSHTLQQDLILVVWSQGSLVPSREYMTLDIIHNYC